MKIEFLNALQSKNYGLAEAYAKQLIKDNPNYKPAVQFLKILEIMKKEGTNEDGNSDSDSSDTESDTGSIDV